MGPFPLTSCVLVRQRIFLQAVEAGEPHLPVQTVFCIVHAHKSTAQPLELAVHPILRMRLQTDRSMEGWNNGRSEESSREVEVWDGPSRLFRNFRPP